MPAASRTVTRSPAKGYLLKAFTAYGKCIESDLTFDALPIADCAEDSILVKMQRVTAIEDHSGAASRTWDAQGRTVYVVFHESSVTVQVDLMISFELWLAAGRIEGFVVNEVSDSLVNYWVLQQIIPLFLLWNGSTEFLHGMAVSSLARNSDQSGDASFTSMAFLGESYAGKSTLLKYFLTRNHTMVTDDQIALSRQNYREVLPATPYYRPFRDWENLGLPAAAYSPKPSKLQRLYLLEPSPPETSPRIEGLAGMEAATALFPHLSYGLYSPDRPERFPFLEDRFRGLTDMARNIRVARLYVPRSLDKLPEVYDFIQADLAVLV